MESLLDRVFSDAEENPSVVWRERLRQIVSSGDGKLVFNQLGVYWQSAIMGEAIEEAEKSTDDLDWSSLAASLRAGAIALLSLFTGRKLPLIIVTDDVQWQTHDERGFWTEILRAAGPLQNTLLLCSCRTEDDRQPELGYTRSTVFRARPLASSSLSYILVHGFHVSPLGISVPPWSVLSKFLLTTTSGNPFHLATLLNTLVRDGVISFNFQDARWDVTLDRLPSYGVDNVELFASYIVESLSRESQDVLRILAYLPSRGIRIVLLARLVNRSVSQLHSQLVESASLGVVTSTGSVVAFSHDRLHSAALSLTSDSDLGPLYAHLASKLEAESGEDYLFVCAELWLAAHDRGVSEGIGADRLCMVTLSAARKAVRSASFGAAARFLAKARSLVDISNPDVWLRDQPLALAMCAVEAEVGACQRRPQAALRVLQTALELVKGVARKIELRTLLFRTMVASLDLMAALDMVASAMIEAGFDINHRVANLPITTDALEARMITARGSHDSANDADDVLLQLVNLINYAGPTLYVLRPDHGFPLFTMALGGIFARPLVLASPTSAYCLALQAVAQADLANWDMARAYVKSAKSYFENSSGIHPAIEIIFASLAYLDVNRLEAVDYQSSYRIAKASSQDTMLAYTGTLALATARVSGRSISRSTEEGTQVLEAVQDVLPPAQRFVLASSLQYLDNLSSKTGRLSDLHRLEGRYLSQADARLFLRQSIGFYTMNHWLCALGLALCLEAPIEDTEVIVENLLEGAAGGDGLIMSHEFGLLLCFYELTRDDLMKQLTYRDSPIWLRTISTCEAFSQNADYAAHRLALLALREAQKLRQGQRPWHSVLPTMEKAIAAYQDVGNNILAGLLCRQGAYAFQPTSPRLANGFIIDSFLCFKRCEAWAAARLLAARFPDLLSATNAWTTAIDPKDDAQSSAPTVGPSSASTEPDSTSQLEDRDETGTRGVGGREKLNLESTLRGFLACASEKDAEELVRKVCTVMTIINRSDSACLVLQDTASQELYLRGIGSSKSFETYHQPVVTSTTLCPSSIILHATHLKHPKSISSGDRLLERESYYKEATPKSLLLVPLFISARNVGCVVLASRLPAGTTEVTDAQVSLLGNFAALLLSSHSTTKTLEQAVKQRTDQLSRAVVQKSSFLANISHELRTPLHSVSSLSLIMANSADMPPNQRDNLSLISDAAEDLLRIINQVLDWSRLDSGAMQLERRPFSLRETVEGSLDAVGPLATAKNLELTLESTVVNDPPHLIGDGNRLRQGLLNLMSNSIKFTATGAVRVRWDVGRRAGSSVLVTLRVSDTGLGVPPEKVSALFQSFSQVDVSTSRIYGGAGLGLVITQGLAKLMGGDCWLDESTEGKGSTFAMSFTATMAQDSECAGSEPYRLSGPTRSAVILSARDVSAMAGNLRAFGVESQVIPDLDTYMREVADVEYAFIDVQAYGLSLAELVKLRTKRPAMRVIYLVALYDMTAAIERLGISHTQIVTLPVKASALLHAIQVAPGVIMPETFKVTKKGSLIDKELAQKCPMKILFVDDSLVNLGVGVKILNKFGYTGIATATDGILAVAAERESKPDCVFLDLAMPHKDGYSAATDILTSYGPGKAPVLVAPTANTDQDTKDRCMETGFSYFLSKPLLLGDLVRILSGAYQSRFGGAEDLRRESISHVNQESV